MSALTKILTRDLKRITSRLKLYPTKLNADDVKVLIGQLKDFLEVYQTVVPKGAQADPQLEAQINSFCQLHASQRKSWDKMYPGTVVAIEQLCQLNGTCPSRQEGVNHGDKTHDLKPKRRGVLSSLLGRMT